MANCSTFLFAKTELEKQLLDLIEPIVSAHGCELVALKVGTFQGQIKLLLFIDEQAGVSAIKMEKLEFLSRLVGDALDVADAKLNLFKSSYELEVSSPGLDRPLAKLEHFTAALNKKIRLKTDTKERPKTLTGILEQADESGLILKPKDEKESTKFLWSEIRDANLIYEFAQKQSKKKQN